MSTSKEVETVSTTELTRHLGEYLARVRFGRKTIVVEKNNVPVAELRPLPDGAATLADLLSLWKRLTFDTQFASDLERVNAADQPMRNPWES